MRGGVAGQGVGSAPGNSVCMGGGCGAVVTDQQSAMAAFRRGGERAALMSGRTTDLGQTFPSCDPGASRGSLGGRS